MSLCYWDAVEMSEFMTSGVCWIYLLVSIGFCGIFLRLDSMNFDRQILTCSHTFSLIADLFYDNRRVRVNCLPYIMVIKCQYHGKDDHDE
jgi:hypothetical protein